MTRSGYAGNRSKKGLRAAKHEQQRKKSEIFLRLTHELAERVKKEWPDMRECHNATQVLMRLLHEERITSEPTGNVEEPRVRTHVDVPCVFRKTVCGNNFLSSTKGADPLLNIINFLPTAGCFRTLRHEEWADIICGPGEYL